MKPNGIGTVLVVAAALWTLDASAMYPPVDPVTPDHPQRVVIKLKRGALAPRAPVATGTSVTGIRSLDYLHIRRGVRHVRPLVPPIRAALQSGPFRDYLVVDVPPGTDADDLVRDYLATGDVESAERDELLSVFTPPTDSLYSQQWALNNTGQVHLHVLRIDGAGNDFQMHVAGVPDADVDAEEVLINPPADAAKAVVAIIDTGVDRDHPELQGKLWTNQLEIPGNNFDDDHNGYVDDVHGWDHSGDVFWIPPLNDGDNDPRDAVGHGSHCAGIVAAAANNQQGIAGIAGPCEIMAVKIFPLALTSVASQAIIYAADNGADVINMSWGGPWRSTVLEEAVNYALSRGVVLCAAAGNLGDDSPQYPAAYPGVITVGATNDSDYVTYFSSYGEHINLAAPGQSILSIRGAGTDMYASSGEPDVHVVANQYYLASGTSMASPMVAGAAAWLRALSPGLNPQAVQRILESSADDLILPIKDGEFLPGWDPYSGSGRLNLKRSVDAAPSERAAIVAPVPHAIEGGTVVVTGTAESDRGLGYVLDYGPGSSPASWTECARGPAQVSSDSLGAWITDGLQGTYTLRLRVGDSNSALVSVSLTNSRDVRITSPASGDTVVSWASVTGTALDTNFVSYLVELGEGTQPDNWEAVNFSSSPVIGGELAIWHAGGRPDGWYSFRLLLVSGTGVLAADTVTFYLRSTFSTPSAWRVPVRSDAAARVANFGDFNGDGAQEIVIGTTQGVATFTTTGLEVTSGNPDFALVGSCQIPLAVGDTDGDGKDDLVAINDEGEVWIFSSTEQPHHFPVIQPPFLGSLTGIEEFRMAGLYLKDLDGDNRDEIHYYPGFTTSAQSVYQVYNSDGSLRYHVPPHLYAGERMFHEYFPADLNGDGLCELFVASDKLYRLNSDAVAVDSLVLLDSAGHGAHCISLSTVDINSDGLQELVALAVSDATPSMYVLYAFDQYLQPLPGWPHNTGIEFYWAPSDPVFCDLDGDDTPEYFMSWFDTQFGRVSAWRADGTPLSGHTSYSVWTSSLDPGKLRSPVAADVNDDGLPDVISCATEDMYLTFSVERILSWDPQGRVLPGWPIITESGGLLAGSGQRYTTACGDIDGNGITDVMMVTSNNNLVFVNIEGARYDSSTVGVEFWRYNRSLDNSVLPNDAFRIRAIVPTRHQPEVSPQTSIVLGFNRDVDPGSVTAGAVAVTGSVSGWHTGALQLDAMARTVSFVPDTPFDIGEIVTVQISADLRSTAGVLLPHDVQSSFVVNAVIPAVVSHTPGAGEDDVSRHAPIHIQLNSDIDVSTLADSNVQVTGVVGGRYSGQVHFDSTSRTLTFTTDEPFLSAEVIDVSVKPGFKSRFGITMTEALQWSFRVGWPSIAAKVPADHTVGASRSTHISLVFAEPVSPTAVHESTLVAYSAWSGRIVGATHYIATSQSARFVPNKPLRLGDRITVTAPRLKRSWSFMVNSVGGEGQFGNGFGYSTGASPRQLTAGDVTGDGHVDLVAARWPSPFIYLFENDGKGIFSRDSVLAGGSLRHTLLADTDGDGDLDLVATDEIGHALMLLSNDGDGNFASSVTHPVSTVLSSLAADITGEGHVDLITQSTETAGMSVLTNNGDGSFSSPQVLATPAPVAHTVAVDLTGDGRLDLVVGDTVGDIYLIEAGDGLGSPVLIWNDTLAVVSLASADVDKNGDVEILALMDGGEIVILSYLDPSGLVATSAITVSSNTRQIEMADLDADGFVDIVTADGADGFVSILMNNGTGMFKDPVRWPTDDSAWSVVVADLDSDGDLDWSAGGSHSVRVAYHGTTSSVSDDPQVLLPAQYELAQNYPNPFNPSTTISFGLPEPEHVRLEVFNILGQRVAVLQDGVMQAGYYDLSWDGRSDNGASLSSGMYFYRLRSESFEQTNKMMLLK